MPGLAALLMSGNSGGIVGPIAGLIGRFGLRPGRGCAPLGLRLAALEIGPQRRPQAALLAGLLGALGTLVHGGKTKGRRHAMEALLARPGCALGACAALALVARIASFAAAFLAISQPARRCRSSVVEHSLGKGEVVSSILTGSTMKKCRSYWAFALSPLPLKLQLSWIIRGRVRCPPP